LLAVVSGASSRIVLPLRAPSLLPTPSWCSTGATASGWRQWLQAYARRTRMQTWSPSLVGDSGKEGAHIQLVALALSKFGALHITFNNADVFPLIPLQQITKAQVAQLLDIHGKRLICERKQQPAHSAARAAAASLSACSFSIRINLN